MEARNDWRRAAGAIRNEVDEPLVLSGRFAARLTRSLRAMGEYNLKGFAGAERVFAPTTTTPEPTALQR
jgi:hypothetical protein